ncbi:MAG: 4a-hydroxytetrahydrobiopterin dehydratase [Pirellulales bacterium]|jgi:4a-hydroxytetrahydrobiopterin dehydratase
MEIQESCDLRQMKCKPCEGGVEPCTLDEATHQAVKLQGWVLTHNGQRIRKQWVVQNFMAAIDFFNQVAQVAEEDGHHPDLHVSGYRNVSIELWTHAIGGLSENDFILAAKIDAIPILLK